MISWAFLLALHFFISRRFKDPNPGDLQLAIPQATYPQIQRAMVPTSGNPGRLTSHNNKLLEEIWLTSWDGPKTLEVVSNGVNYLYLNWLARRISACHQWYNLPPIQASQDLIKLVKMPPLGGWFFFPTSIGQNSFLPEKKKHA